MQSKIQENLARNIPNGFTLTELTAALSVIAIISCLVVLVVYWEDMTTSQDAYNTQTASGIETVALAQMDKIAEACRLYYSDHAGFPNSLNELTGIYLDPGYNDAVYLDPWNNRFSILISDDGGAAPTAVIRSSGPNCRDDFGANDDLYLSVSSIQPGRKTTDYKLGIAQAALNRTPSLVLTSHWAGPGGIREQLGLDKIFDHDGWGNTFGISHSSRTVFSPGPNGNAGYRQDNIPTGLVANAGTVQPQVELGSISK
jgi:prepilin-type N-terminal cleavage/methylation domain-containing protein